jgi:hypothetical protein
MSKEGRKTRSDRKKSVKETLGKIDEAKKSGKRRVDAMLDELKEDDVYDVVDEDTYQGLVRKRQAEGSFVEDDGGGMSDPLCRCLDASLPFMFFLLQILLVTPMMAKKCLKKTKALARRNKN